MEKQTTAILKNYVETKNLSRREGEVFGCVVGGCISAVDISKSLGISSNTVRIHLKNINIKVGTKSKTGAVVDFMNYALSNNPLP